MNEPQTLAMRDINGNIVHATIGDPVMTQAALCWGIVPVGTRGVITGLTVFHHCPSANSILVVFPLPTRDHTASFPWPMNPLRVVTGSNQ